MTESTTKPYVVCLRNDGYPASLERRKLYELLDDPDAAQHGMLRVVDESGEDYLYPAGYFAEVDLPVSVQDAFSMAS